MTNALLAMGAVVECANCGTPFTMTAFLEEKRRKDAGSFYCPNGHVLTFGESEESKLKRQLKTMEQDRDWERQRRENAERSLVATKGVVTKMRKRAIVGACQFCHRSFANVARHMASKHPNEQPEVQAS